MQFKFRFGQYKYDQWYRKFALVPCKVGKFPNGDLVYAWLEYYEYRILSEGRTTSFQNVEYRPIPCPPDVTPLSYRMCTESE